MLRKLYDWVMAQADKTHARWTLFWVSFAESSVFPIPPDAMLLPMALADRKNWLRLTFICTAGSVLGGLLGYVLGYFFFETAGQWVVQTYHLESAFQKFHDGFNEYGVWIILAKGLTPIPYKLVTIASGVAHFPLLPFILASILTRGLRFLLVAYLAYKFGDPVREFVEKYLNWVAFGFLAVIVLGVAIIAL